MSHEIATDRNSHAVSILNGMEEMMREESLCDFTIKVGSGEIKAHRLVLANASNYFRSMLESGMKESQSCSVEMADIDYECMKICLDFIYNNKVTIPVGKYEDLLYVANMLQLNKFCDYIYAKLDEELDSQLFFAARRIAVMYGQKKLEEKCVKVAEENFVSISKQDEFRDLDMQYVRKIISSKSLKMTEEEKLDVVLRFVKVEKKRRRQLPEMIELVDLGIVPLKRRKIVMENEPMVSDNFKVYKVFATSLWTDLKLGATRHESAILLFDDPSRHLLHFNPRDNTVTKMKEMLDRMTRQDYSAIAIDKYVCVLMRQKFCRYKYSDATSPWEQMPDLICDHGLRPPVTATGNCMFVCGGSFHTETAAFEKFDLRERKWERLKDTPRACSASAILASNGNVYCIGGRVQSSATNRVDRFNIASSTWAEIAPMKYRRDHAAAVEANESIFVLGGWDDVADLDKAERYCVSSNQWTEIKPMKIARGRLKAFAIEGAIYAVGGWDCDAEGNIEKYQIARDEWEVVIKLSSSEGELMIYDSVEIKM